MRRKLAISLLIPALVLAGCGDKSDSGNSAPSASGSAAASNTEKESDQIDLTGVWTQSNSATGEPGMEARIKGDVIEVKWLIDGAPGNGIYWVGNFNPMVAKDGPTTFTSTRDKVATDTELMAASADTKDFTYENGKLSFTVAIENDEAIAEMTRSGDLAEGEDVSSPGTETTFVDGLYSSPNMDIKITDSKVIAPGEPGNEYSDKPVIAFYYDVTNKGTEPVSPSDWLWTFKAIQDNDPNKVNELEVGASPDEELANDEFADIKQGGTVSGAVAYVLSDSETPVQLVAETIGGTEIGRQDFPVK